MVFRILQRCISVSSENVLNSINCFYLDTTATAKQPQGLISIWVVMHFHCLFIPPSSKFVYVTFSALHFYSRVTHVQCNKCQLGKKNPNLWYRFVPPNAIYCEMRTNYSETWFWCGKCGTASSQTSWQQYYCQYNSHMKIVCLLWANKVNSVCVQLLLHNHNKYMTTRYIYVYCIEPLNLFGVLCACDIFDC